MVRAEEEGGGVVEDGAEHSADLTAFVAKAGVVGVGEVAAVTGQVEPGFGFAVLAIGSGEFAEEVGFVATFGPGCAQLRASGAGGAPDLVGQGVFFFERSGFAQAKDFHRQGIGLLIDSQVLC